MARELVLLLITLVAFAAWGVPNLLAFLALLRPGRFRAAFDDEFDLEDLDTPHREVCDTLIDLGFHLLGCKTETPAVGPTLREVAFADPDRRTFAAVHGLDRGEPNAYFYTPFRDGAVVLTADREMEPVKGPGFVHQGAAGRSLEAVLAAHLKTVKKIEAQGHEPFTRFDRKARLKATDLYYARPEATALQRKLRRKALGNFASSLALVVLAGLFLAYRFLRSRGD